MRQAEVKYGRAPRIAVSLDIAGRHIDPNQITKILGVEPTQVWTQSRPELAARPELDTVCWSIRIEDEHSRSVSTVVERLLDRVLPLRDGIEALRARFSVHANVNVTVHIDEDRPVYDLSGDAVANLAALGCGVGLDIFDCSEGR